MLVSSSHACIGVPEDPCHSGYMTRPFASVVVSVVKVLLPCVHVLLCILFFRLHPFTQRRNFTSEPIKKLRVIKNNDQSIFRSLFDKCWIMKTLVY